MHFLIAHRTGVVGVLSLLMILATLFMLVSVILGHLFVCAHPFR